MSVARVFAVLSTFFRPAFFLILSLSVWVSAISLPASVAQSSQSPILLISNAANSNNPFNQFLFEVLNTEGIKSYQQIDISNLTEAALEQAQLVVLSETLLQSNQADMLARYIQNNGRLVAIRPDRALWPYLGIVSGEEQAAPNSPTALTLRLDDQRPLSAGLTERQLPLYVSYTRYSLSFGAEIEAWIQQDAETEDAGIIRYGNTITWAYDPVQQIVFTRQGNPANINRTIPNVSGIRTFGLFYQKIDVNSVDLAHADIQMRLLGRTISDLINMPLPRLWYFPENHRTMLIPTGDAHGNELAYYNNLLDTLEQYDANMTFYITRHSPHLTNQHISDWRARGHEVSMHPYGPASDNVANLAEGFQISYNWFSNRQTTPDRTVRNHMVEWPNWVDSATIAANMGLGMDTNFYTWGPAVYTGNTQNNGRPEQAHGYINGSGLPMRFTNEQGQLINLYQQVTSLVDMQLLGESPTNPAQNSQQLGVTGATSISTQLIDASQNGNYAAIMTQFHVDYYTENNQIRQWVNNTLNYARSLNIPIWDAQQWLEFTEARQASHIQQIQWNAQNGVLQFGMPVQFTNNFEANKTLSVMLPSSQDGQALLHVENNGQAVTWSVEQINGREYAFVQLPEGMNQVIAWYEPKAPEPTPTEIVPSITPTATASPTVTTPVATNTPTSTPTTIPSNTPTSTPTIIPTATPTTGPISQTPVQVPPQYSVFISLVRK